MKTGIELATKQINMKIRTAKLISIATFIGLLGSITLNAQTNNIAVNDDGSAPNAAALLDVSSNNLIGPKRGMLIPRMTEANKLAIAAPADALMVYQTDGVIGYYYYEAGIAQWIRFATGTAAWSLVGNAGTNAATEFIGTTDAVDMVMRTNNVEVARLSATGNFGLGTPTPVELLDVAGALKLSGTSMTNNAGVIRWNNGLDYHEGNLNGTGAGWIKLENDYAEIFNAAFLQPAPIVCAAGTVDIGPDNANATGALISPFPNQYRYFRHQYLFQRNELDQQISLSQSGLCAGQPISSIAFNATSTTGIPMLLRITIKHTTTSSLTGFDGSVDPLAQCWGTGLCGIPPTYPASPNWNTFTFCNPFVWNGTDNIIIEVCGLGAAQGPTNVAVRRTTGLTFNGTYGAAALSTQGCGAAAPGPGQCSTGQQGCGMASGCGAVNGFSNSRPVVRWGGVVGTSGPPIASFGDYVNYNGGFIVEATPGWAASNTPAYSFKGPGTISAENGVWDGSTQLSDYVFDSYFDGKVSEEDQERHGGFSLMSMAEMAEYTKTERHLPTMKGRSEWEAEGGFGLGDLGNQLWVTVETQAIYLTQLNEKLDLLHALNSNSELSAEEFDSVKASLEENADLSKKQKKKLLKYYSALVINENCN